MAADYHAYKVITRRELAHRHQDIDCGHRLFNHEGKCAHLHGHTYRIHFFCSGKQDALGRVIDFSVMKFLLCDWIVEKWDHRMLIWDQDPVLPALQALDEKVTPVPFNPSAENIAAYLLEVIGPKVLAGTGVQLMRVRVEETRKCAAISEAELVQDVRH